MLPTGKPNVYAGDVYILDRLDIVGIMEGILFRKWLWIILNCFFVLSDMKKVAKSKLKSGNSLADEPVVTKNIDLSFEC
jgi:hypothetical protein